VRSWEQIGNCTLYRGGCVKILQSSIGKVDTVVTDPVWPNNTIEAFSLIDPFDFEEKK